MTSKSNNILGTKAIFPLLINYSLPSIASMIITSTYNIADQLFIGHAVGYLGNGATTAIFPLTTLASAFSVLIGAGAAAKISIDMGKNNKQEIKKTTANAIFILIIISITLSAAILVFIRPLLSLLGATKDIFPYAMDYGRIIAFGFPFSMLNMAMASIIRADESPKYSLLSTLSGVVINLALDPIFIFVFGWGVKGAAITTVIGQGVSCTISVLYMFKYAKHVKFKIRDAILSVRVISSIAVLGSSKFITQIAITIVNLVLNRSLTFYGEKSPYGADIPISAMGICMKINSILISCVIGFSLGAQPILGYNYGAKNYKRVKQTYILEIILSLTLSSLLCILFVTMPDKLISVFGDKNKEFNDFAALCLKTYMSFVFLAGIQIPSANFFQAIGKPLKAILLTMTRQFFCLIPALYILPKYWGLNGILYSGPAADIISVFVTAIFIIKELRHLDKKI